MALDRPVRDFFHSWEKSTGRRSIERMLLQDVPAGGDPNAVAKLAALAKQYLLEEYRYTPVMVDGRVIDRARMDRWTEAEAQRKPRVNSPMMDDLRPTTQVREPIGRERNPHSSSKGRKGRSYFKDAEAKGKVAFVLDGKTFMLDPDIIKILMGDPKANG